MQWGRTKYEEEEEEDEEEEEEEEEEDEEEEAGRQGQGVARHWKNIILGKRWRKNAHTRYHRRIEGRKERKKGGWDVEWHEIEENRIILTVEPFK